MWGPRPTMASRPVSNRRRNYNQRATDFTESHDLNDEFHDVPGLASNAGHEGTHAHWADEEEPAPRTSGEMASTMGRPSGEYEDAFDDAEPYESEYGAPSAAERYSDAPSAYDPESEYGTSYGGAGAGAAPSSRHAPASRHAPGTRQYTTDYDDEPAHYERDVRIERPHTEGANAENYYGSKQKELDYEYRPEYPSAGEDEDVGGFPAFFHHPVGQYGNFNIFQRLYLEIRQMASFGLTSVALVVVANLAFISYFNPFRKSPPKARTDLEFERRITGERLSGRVEYYAEYWGYKCEEYEITTRGGWILKAHRISDPRRPGGRGYPVIVQHGILCNSLFYFTNEERSLGFWLVDQGFDVWSTNVRSNYNAGHTQYGRWDPRFWAWGMMELAEDLVDVVNYILQQTGYSQLAYIGHSQGTASMFLALSNGKYPSLGNKLSSFCALGPAVFPGPSLRRFPFRVMQLLTSRFAWSFVFGVRDFFPAIELGRQVAPAYIFGHFAYVIFAYLFDFHDHNWIDRLKPKIFRSTGIQTSSELLYFYMRSFVGRGCIFDPNVHTPWFPKQFPPLTVVYGTTDYLVVGKPLVERLLRYENNVEIVHIVELQGFEHMDMVLGVDAYKVVFPKIKDTIVRTMDLEDMPAKAVM